MDTGVWWQHGKELRDPVVMHAFTGRAEVSLCGKATRDDELRVMGKLDCVGCFLAARELQRQEGG